MALESFAGAASAATSRPEILGHSVPNETQHDSNPTTGVLSPTTVGLHAAGWLMLACLFLPVSRGCNGAVVRPVNGLSVSAPVHPSDLLGCAVLVTAYGNGVLIAFLITLSAWLHSRDFWWRSFAVQFAVTLGIGTTMMGLMTLYAGSLERWLQDTLSFVPLLAGGTTWIALALRRGEQEQAWARLQHLWTIAGWVVLHLQCIFSTALLFGYWMTLCALAAQLFAVELASHRMHHDLWDRSHPVRMPQFSLGRIFIWMTVLPLVPAYYQAVSAVLDWFFHKN